ncbi:winged helix-turn-helix domain-containing protein [Psychroserpens sp.]|uniref:winged helix-turn-helix domain-containing protein n=1 Tax=Psychroserpens sp. TaxID=2020870 RepID=UPI00385C271D
MRRHLYIILFLSVLVFFNCSQDNSSTEITKIALRDVGHKLLMSYRDSTSLILPVKKITKEKFELSFQSQLGFNPDSLVVFVKHSIDKTNLPKDYRVEVIQCEDNEVAYSYEVKNDKDESIIPCGGRELPLNCYTIQIHFINSKTQNIIYFWLIPLILVAFGLAWWFYRKKNNDKNTLENPLFYKIGNYKFDKDQSKLLYVEKEIGLSKKECELLEILCDNLNDVVKRDELSKRVWEDHGVFVGRSLDTYISKLRKKLKEDTSIKITNVHGVGYKLEVSKA